MMTEISYVVVYNGVRYNDNRTEMRRKSEWEENTAFISLLVPHGIAPARAFLTVAGIFLISFDTFRIEPYHSI